MVQHFLSWAIKMVDQGKGYHLGNKYRTYHSSFWYLEGPCMRNFFERLTSSGVMANIAIVAKLSGISDSKQSHV